jgi:hypothetical protein
MRKDRTIEHIKDRPDDEDVARLLGLSVEFPLLAGWLREKLSNLQDDDKFSLHEEDGEIRIRIWPRGVRSKPSTQYPSVYS